MRSAGIILTLFAGCAVGVTVAHFAQQPVAQSASPSLPLFTSVIRGHFGAIDTIEHRVLFNATSPYTLSDTIPLQIQYGTSTRISVGVGDFRVAGYKSASSTADDIKPGTAGFIILSRKSGSLHALSIFHTTMTESDL